MFKILFLPAKIEAECANNENIFTVAKRMNVKISTACNGYGTCGLCRIKVIDGEDCLNKQTRAELNHLGNVYFINKQRLSCQTKFIKDGYVTIKTNE